MPSILQDSKIVNIAAARSPPASEPRKTKFLRVIARGLIARSAALLVISNRPSVVYRVSADHREVAYRMALPGWHSNCIVRSQSRVPRAWIAPANMEGATLRARSGNGVAASLRRVPNAAAGQPRDDDREEAEACREVPGTSG